MARRRQRKPRGRIRTIPLSSGICKMQDDIVQCWTSALKEAIEAEKVQCRRKPRYAKACRVLLTQVDSERFAEMTVRLVIRRCLGKKTEPHAASIVKGLAEELTADKLNCGGNFESRVHLAAHAVKLLIKKVRRILPWRIILKSEINGRDENAVTFG